MNQSFLKWNPCLDILSEVITTTGDHATMFMLKKKTQMPSESQAMPGRDVAMVVSNRHYVNDNPLQGPFPSSLEQVILGLGCFWGAESKFWSLAGVYTTAVGYSSGYTKNPTYEEVCTGMTGHNEVVLVVYDPGVLGYADILKVFWESHDPTQGMQQGNDVGTQYRSGIYFTSDAQEEVSRSSLHEYQSALKAAGYSSITTEILPAAEFYYAEDYHQQYLAKNPRGYCGLGGTGVVCPVGLVQ